MTKLITCVICPMGCVVTVIGEDGKIDCIKGYTCHRGRVYAENEFIRPTRTLTSTIHVEGGLQPVCPVRTTKPVPKDLVDACLEQIYLVKVKAPIKMYQTIIENIDGTGADVVATSPIERE